jgi:signal transduction histidine kinase/CheY-like chemotaxis protein
MSTILVVDDLPVNRQYLATLLGYAGHRVVEAEDGIEALAVARRERPQLAIVDILMPRMNGIEFVRELRQESSVNNASILFYTATYRLEEAQQMAGSVGVTDVLRKPARPEEILETVDKLLGRPAGTSLAYASASMQQSTFQLEHLNTRMAAMIELQLELAAQTDLDVLLKTICRGARAILGARRSAVGIVTDDGKSLLRFVADGTSETSLEPARPPLPDAGVLRVLLASHRPQRIRKDSSAAVSTDREPSSGGFPDYDACQSFLGLPLRTPSRCYGWLYFVDRVDGQDFDVEDERLAATLAAQFTIVYENTCLLEQVGRTVLKLQESNRQLGKAHDELEQRVEQRTRELVQAQSTLQQNASELERRAAQLERSNKELEVYAHVASHDLQEPLRSISGFCELLRDRYRGQFDEQADRWLDKVIRGSGRMKTMIQDMLTYSQVQSGGQRFCPTDLARVFDEAVENLSQPIRESQAQVTHDELPTIFCDPTQMVLLFQNLIGNAVKYHGGEPPGVHVSARQAQQNWVFSVADNGIGIAPEHFDRIFQRFKRLHRQSEYQGTGMGLAICQCIAQRHAGRIWVKSEPGQGSVFSVEIPAGSDSTIVETTDVAKCGVVSSQAGEHAPSYPGLAAN